MNAPNPSTLRKQVGVASTSGSASALPIVTVGGSSPKPSRLTMTVIGPPKSGKTTFGANIVHTINGDPNSVGALLVDLEDGAWHVPYEIPVIRPKSWDELKSYCTLAASHTLPNGKRINAIVVDTIDYAYDLLVEHALRKFGVGALGEAAYGAGWAYVRDELMNFLNNVLRANFALVVLLAHSRVGDSSETPRIDIPGKAGRSIIAWSDAVGVISIREQNDGSMSSMISFSPGIGETGSRIAALQGRVVKADWQSLRTLLLDNRSG